MPGTGAECHHATDLRRFQSIADPARPIDTCREGIDNWILDSIISAPPGRCDVGYTADGPARLPRGEKAPMDGCFWIAPAAAALLLTASGAALAGDSAADEQALERRLVVLEAKLAPPDPNAGD